jgi:hypothetical protein
MKKYFLLILYSYFCGILLYVNGRQMIDADVSVLDFAAAIAQFQPIMSIPLFAGVALIIGLIAKWLKYDFWKYTYKALFAFMIFTAILLS